MEVSLYIILPITPRGTNSIKQLVLHRFLRPSFIALQMTVTWTSGYNIDEAIAFVEWGMKGQSQRRSPAGTLTFTRNSMCGKTLIDIN